MVTVNMLRDHIGIPGPKPVLWCSVCKVEYSASVGDYFMHHPETVLMCCQQNLKLVYRKVVYVEALQPPRRHARV